MGLPPGGRTAIAPIIERLAILADGAASMLSTAVGGPPNTTYSEKGVMAATRVYSTAAYWAAAGFALLFGLCPKFGAVVAAIPGRVLGGITVILYGMIGLLGTGYHVLRAFAPAHLKQQEPLLDSGTSAYDSES